MATGAQGGNRFSCTISSTDSTHIAFHCGRPSSSRTVACYNQRRLTTASRAVAGAPEEAALFLESEVTDSVSGARLMVEVREGTGEKLKETVAGEKVVTLETLKPLIDRWLQGGVKEATKYIRPR